MDKKYVPKSEIKKEFQVERMILFSDAVFAIVITLMAIEIRIPDTHVTLNETMLLTELKHLVPVIISYALSFFFIGAIWFQHLKIFSIVKDYDKGLIFRNFALLFFIGLFPFSASIITRSHGPSIALFIYLGIILLCSISQYILHNYLINQRPFLRVEVNLQEHNLELKKKKVLIISFFIVFVLSILLYYLLKDAENKSLITLLILPVVIIYRVIYRKKK